MATRKQERVDRLQQAIASLPVLKSVLDEAFEFFESFGELPEEQHIAEAVVRRVLGDDLQEHRPLTGLALIIEQTCDPNYEWKPPPPSVRQCLFHEAVYGEGAVQKMARIAIEIEVSHGSKVTDPQFAAHHGLPKYGSVGRRVLGYPDKLALPPYEDQARRLFARQEALLDQINQDDPNWTDPIAEAIVAFQTQGTLPADEVLCGLVLADAEMTALWRHKRGKDVAEFMAAFDTAAKATNEKGEDAVRKLAEIHMHQRTVPTPAT